MGPSNHIKDVWRRSSRGTHVEGGHISTVQSHLIAASGEFVGTFFFLWIAYSAQLMVGSQASSLAIGGGSSSETIVFVSLVYSFSLLVNAWAFYRISGGLFNPAVSTRSQHLPVLSDFTDPGPVGGGGRRGRNEMWCGRLPGPG